MKLRNKKTGEIVDLWHGDINSDMNGENIIISSMKLHEKGINWADKKYTDWSYKSLAELNEEWEDYKPAKPLIKDKKKRKLIRDWAELNGIKVVSVCETFNAWGVKNIAEGEPGDKEYMLADILFRGEKPEKLEFGKEYTIPELCGKEEE